MHAPAGRELAIGNPRVSPASWAVGPRAGAGSGGEARTRPCRARRCQAPAPPGRSRRAQEQCARVARGFGASKAMHCSTFALLKPLRRVSIKLLSPLEPTGHAPRLAVPRNYTPLTGTSKSFRPPCDPEKGQEPPALSSNRGVAIAHCRLGLVTGAFPLARLRPPLTNG